MTSKIFRDKWTTCGGCGNRFVFRLTERRALAEQGRPVQPPSMCRRCRQAEPRAPGNSQGAGTTNSRYADKSRNGNSRVYVGRLSFDTTEEGLRQLFETVGRVLSAEVIRDRDTGWSRGFAFVEMATPKAAQRAIVTLNGARLEGRQIKVAEARPRRSPPARHRDQTRW